MRWLLIRPREKKVTTLKNAFFLSPRTIKFAFIFLLLILVSAAPFTPSVSTSAAFACACCAESGEWFERVGKLEAFEVAELRNVKFDKTASPYLNAAGFEVLEGFPAEYMSFNLSATLNTRLSLTLTLKGERGETGSIVLPLPKVATSFGADLHDMEEGSAGPILYKEWRFEGIASGTGIFRKSIVRGTKFKFILQGRGNNCLSSTDFKSWRLNIKGTRADYALYGSLVQ
jgi:hypothetical protein